MAEEKKPLPLAEIVTGVIITIILIVYALPRFMNWDEGSAIGDEISKLYFDIETAKNTAVKTKHRVWIEFQGTSGYTIFEDTNKNGTADTGEPIRRIKLDPGIQFGVTLDPPIQNVWGTAPISQPVEFTGGKKKLYFEPSGKASNTGAVYFIAKRDVANSNADIRALKIIGANGQISVLKISRTDSPPWK